MKPAYTVDVAHPGFKELSDVRSLLEDFSRSSERGARWTVWEEVGVMLGKAREHAEIEPERWFIELILAFVNEDTDTSQMRDRIKSGKMQMVTDPDAPVHERLESYEAGMKLRRTRWLEFLTDIVAIRRRSRLSQTARRARLEDAAARFQPDAKQGLEGIWMLPDLRQTRDGPRILPHYIVLNLDSFETFVSTLLLDDTLGNDLSRCKLAGCGRFFLVRKRGKHQGRKQRDYCIASHADQAHEASALYRKRESRARKLLVAKGYTREKAAEYIEGMGVKHRDKTAKQLMELARAAIRSERKSAT